MTHVLIVCTGNMCRSPLAAVMLESELQKRGVVGVTVSSAGTGAWDGNRASEGAVLIGLEHGLDLSDHRAQHLKRKTVEESDLIFVMERAHAVRVQRLGGGDKVHVLGEYAGQRRSRAEVPDPYGGDLNAYRNTYSQLLPFIEAVAERIVAEIDD